MLDLLILHGCHSLKQAFQFYNYKKRKENTVYKSEYIDILNLYEQGKMEKSNSSIVSLVAHRKLNLPFNFYVQTINWLYNKMWVQFSQYILHSTKGSPQVLSGFFSYSADNTPRLVLVHPHILMVQTILKYIIQTNSRRTCVLLISESISRRKF